MCVAIHAPASATLIPYDDFESMRAANSDGMGMMWAEGGKLRIIRQLRRLRRFWKRYKALHDAGRDVVLHFRYATQGDTTLRNVHPVHVNQRLALVHNGILDGFSIKDIRSDTRQFVDAVLKHLPNEWYKLEGGAWDSMEAITTGSKFIFMDSDGFVRIMHQDSGWDVEGNWFSSLQWQYHWQSAIYGTTKKQDATDRAWRAWWEDEDKERRARFQSHYVGTEATRETFHTHPNSVASYLHWPSGSIVCDECREKELDEEPTYNFQTLWDDKEPIVCEFCDRVVNQDQMMYLHGVGA